MSESSHRSRPELRASLLRIRIRIREARLRASLAVDAGLVSLYWQIGRDILERQTEMDGAPEWLTAWPWTCGRGLRR
jgi:hypothetical protein